MGVEEANIPKIQTVIT